jgi:sulfatase maturation enzyme AslB (radical SAM superfamily)
MVNTRTCNLDCAYCYQGSHAQLPQGFGLKKHMPDETLERALPWMVDWTMRGLSMTWYGGEPLIGFEQMREWVPRIEKSFVDSRKKIRQGITTNGTLLTADVRAFLDEHKIGVLLSLDGPPWLHDQTRVHYDGKGSWHEIDVDAILAWRPDIEIAWQLDPAVDFKPEDIDWMLARGFRNQNYNLQWLVPWSADARIRLERFMKHVGRLCIQKKMQSNWLARLDKALTAPAKMAVPCGTGLQMLALTPEGWLYPSQEMAFTAFHPGKAVGTELHYRVGDVFKTPVIDAMRQLDVADIKTEQMKPPAPFDCNDCIAKTVSIGGCHCRYIGQDGIDPRNRFEVPEGYCQSQIASITGLTQAAVIERYVAPAPPKSSGLQVAIPRAQPAGGGSDIAARLRALEIATQKVLKRMDGLAVVVIEPDKES